MASAVSLLDCPICYEEMRPPKQIFQCMNGHSLCGQCKDRVSECPTCRTPMGPGRVVRNRHTESIFRELTGIINNNDHENDKTKTNESSLLLLTSTGPAAEYQGPVFGLYREAGLHNGVKYYRQVDRSNRGRYMYHHSKDKWYVADTLGEYGGSLRNLISSDTVPVTGWQCSVLGKWHHDESIKVTPVEDMASVLCGDITITVSGKAVKHQSTRAGVFKPTGEISAGRQLFRNPQTGKYLNVIPGQVNWGVRDNIGAPTAWILSGCAPDMCPASARASYSDRLNIKHWQYWDGNKWHDSAEIIVKCSTHTHGDCK